MDATTRKTVTANMAGRSVEISIPTDNQLAALMMIQSEQLNDLAKVDLITELFLALLPDEDAKKWFIRQLCINTYSVQEIAETIMSLGSPEEPKKTAKKTAARRTR